MKEFQHKEAYYIINWTVVYHAVSIQCNMYVSSPNGVFLFACVSYSYVFDFSDI
jgi:hypothetical protein